jgi:hypothetical protein
VNVVPAPTERRIQRAILRRLRELLPAEAFVFHVPNQILAPAETLDAREYGGALLGDGMVPGVPDLFVLHAGRACALEVKKPGVSLSPAQEAVHDRLARAGVPVATVFGVAGAEIVLGAWGLLDGDVDGASWWP